MRPGGRAPRKCDRFANAGPHHARHCNPKRAFSNVYCSVPADDYLSEILQLQFPKFFKIVRYD